MGLTGQSWPYQDTWPPCGANTADSHHRKARSSHPGAQAWLPSVVSSVFTFGTTGTLFRPWASAGVPRLPQLCYLGAAFEHHTLA